MERQDVQYIRVLPNGGRSLFEDLQKAFVAAGRGQDADELQSHVVRLRQVDVPFQYFRSLVRQLVASECVGDREAHAQRRVALQPADDLTQPLLNRLQRQSVLTLPHRLENVGK